MSERPEPDLDRVREAMREHDQRAQEPEPEEPPAEQPEEPEPPADDE